ncbi:hypothetical protein SLE2022_395810 [Rubroshorea leprosula]
MQNNSLKERSLGCNNFYRYSYEKIKKFNKSTVPQGEERRGDSNEPIAAGKIAQSERRGDGVGTEGLSLNRLNRSGFMGLAQIGSLCFCF